MEPVDLSRCEITDLANILNDAFNPEFEADNPEPRLALPLLPFRLGSTDELVLSDLLAEGAALRSISRREVLIYNNPSAVGDDTPALQEGDTYNPEAFSSLHKLATKLTSAFSLACGRPSNELISHLDDLPLALAGGSHNSKLLLSHGVKAPEHIDRGLFNLVIGKVEDLNGLQVAWEGEMCNVTDFLPESSLNQPGLYGIVLPGLTLQVYSECYKAVKHRGNGGTFIFGISPDAVAGRRTTLVFQWRLSPDYPIKLSTLLDYLPSFMPELEMRELYLTQPRPVPRRGYILYIKTLTRDTLEVLCSPEWTIFDVKVAIDELYGMAPDRQRLTFGGQQLEDQRTLQDYGIESTQVAGAAVRVVNKPDSNVAYGARHVTIGDINEKAFGGKTGALTALAKCPLEWRMRDAAKVSSGGEVLDQWDVSGWGKQWVIKVKSSDTLDSYADCLVKNVKNVSILVGPARSGTPWHVTLYGEDENQAKKSFSTYTADAPTVLWHAYYLEVTGTPANGIPGTDYHLTQV